MSTLEELAAMSPDDINKHHGKPTWTCWKCKAESGLYWYNGWSVAVCRSKPECGKAFGDFISEEIAQRDAYNEYGRSIYGEDWDRSY